MNFSEIDLKQTHIRLRTDLPNHNLNEYIIYIRNELENYLLKDQDFLLALEPIKRDGNLPLIVKTMVESSNIADVGPMACVAGTISEMSLDYLIANDSRYSIIENGGDIAMINDEEVLCGIYSNNEVLGNDIAFKIKSRKRPLGICTSSGKIGHSISFGTSDSVTVISKSASNADGLATRIANEINGESSEDKVSNGLECGEDYKEFFEGALIISDNHVGTIGKLPKIVETKEFDVKI
ncbi:MAG: UPF0280 family protein [Methanobrevibacter ruminantium]|uniref:UPF0280 family protein n=1 Tax=Methanobrevibacter ruminantium TaxID=83816 RepID=UPI0026EE5D75|nr:UPF0280 family protein [Methanobrevibacter ruminantium]MDD6049120.1 UPF0280 family protein [Methanobrevibacter ruminantium]MDO5842338.1 UPF0280 family protein [Methanobrevibacter ruminantium]